MSIALFFKNIYIIAFFLNYFNFCIELFSKKCKGIIKCMQNYLNT